MRHAAAVADTHGLIWYMTGQRRRLGRQAFRLFDQAECGEGVIHIPAIVVMEVIEAHERGRIRLPAPVHLWVAELLASPGFRPVSVGVEIVLAAAALGSIPERRDRLIAATAVHLELPLITRDAGIAGAAGLEVVW